ncbi:DNA polymerase III subunit delta [Oceanomicrobium pacificus]|uniref:DNA-directed DNA polymerase n=1 Tax=Oceanomicrobium pacificus TaxID=2692916 RepID=A0A6B0TV53_9RHOB|nr:DNA polymerase III subunit delta [Oceanomicrobium pacificus]MXU64833.1 DNA polymerase III subunit delta [Oceanomicrobium pacificus]
MKLNGADAARFLRTPDPATRAVLLHGEDKARTALKRRELVAALGGKDAEEEMRLVRLGADEVRRDPASLQDALRAQGFFPGPRVTVVEDATDGMLAIFEEALGNASPEDATLVVTAGLLPARSKLRKFFEGAAAGILSIAVYTDAPSAAEIDQWLASRKIEVDPSAKRRLQELAQDLEPTDLVQMLEKLSLYMWNADAAAGLADVEACLPRTIDSDADDLAAAVAEGKVEETCRHLHRLSARGVPPTTLCIALERAFRQIYGIVFHPGGVEAGIGALRPPVFGPRKARLKAQAQRWRPASVERAIRELTDTDLTLRSSSRAPDMALMERALIRIAMMSGR